MILNLESTFKIQGNQCLDLGYPTCITLVLWIRNSSKIIIKIFKPGFNKTNILGHATNIIATNVKMRDVPTSTSVADVGLPTTQPQNAQIAQVLANKVNTPIDPERLDKYLEGYEPTKRKYMVEGFKYGFKLEFSVEGSKRVPKNLISSFSSQSWVTVPRPHLTTFSWRSTTYVHGLAELVNHRLT